jgi:hypothetical protein
MPSRSKVRIRCINRTGHSAVFQKIRFIGGINEDGSTWKLSQQMAVDLIQSGEYQLYVVVNRKPLAVIVGTSADGQNYLKAEIDTEEPTSLLNSPECPFLTQ